MEGVEVGPNFLKEIFRVLNEGFSEFFESSEYLPDVGSKTGYRGSSLVRF